MYFRGTRQRDRTGNFEGSHPSAGRACVDTVRMLVFRDGSGVQRSVPLDREVLTIGRDPGCTIRVASSYVSRTHARVELREDGPILVDLGSHNGTLLNGARVEGTAPLHNGDVIRIGDVSFECVGEQLGETLTLGLPAEQPSDSSVLRVDPQAYEVWIGESQPARRLSAQEFQLLRYLYEHRDRVCTRHELGDTIWGAHNWDPNMLHRLVHRLKEKLEPDLEQHRYIQTVPQIGYRVTP
jgi:pSer/pThr/pTyr-binding forkhead associated (FHA) protein